MKTLIIAILFAVQVQAAEWPSVETKEGAKEFIQNHCFGTRYILLDTGSGTLSEDRTRYSMRIVFAVNKGYGYSTGPFSGAMGIIVRGPYAGIWQIGLDGGFPGPADCK
jgi:hypothetical protein